MKKSLQKSVSGPPNAAASFANPKNREVLLPQQL